MGARDPAAHPPAAQAFTARFKCGASAHNAHRCSSPRAMRSNASGNRRHTRAAETRRPAVPSLIPSASTHMQTATKIPTGDGSCAARPPRGARAIALSGRCSAELVPTTSPTVPNSPFPAVDSDSPCLLSNTRHFEPHIRPRRSFVRQNGGKLDHAREAHASRNLAQTRSKAQRTLIDGATGRQKPVHKNRQKKNSSRIIINHRPRSKGGPNK